MKIVLFVLTLEPSIYIRVAITFLRTRFGGGAGGCPVIRSIVQAFMRSVGRTMTSWPVSQYASRLIHLLLRRHKITPGLDLELEPLRLLRRRPLGLGRRPRLLRRRV